MNLWLRTNISAHPFVSEKYWIDSYNNVKEALPYASIYLYDNDKGFIGIVDKGYIAGLFVEEKYQSQGIGKRLIMHCKQIYNQLSLHVYKDNIKAITFYASNGFKITNEKVDDNTGLLEYEMFWEKENI